MNNLVQFLRVFVQSTPNFVFKLWEIVEKMKTDVDRLLLVSKMKKSSILGKYIRDFLFIIKTKSSLSTSVFIFVTISQILKTKCYVHKHVGTGPNCSHELTTFIKYHMLIIDYG